MVIAACGFAEMLCRFSKDDISNRVAIGIVDPLEVIEVSDEDRDGMTASFSP